MKYVHIQLAYRHLIGTASKYVHILFFFFYVGPPKEDIFSGHFLSPLFQSTLHITITNICMKLAKIAFLVTNENMGLCLYIYL